MNFIRLTPLFTAMAVALAANAADDTAPPNGVANFHSVKEIVDVVPRTLMTQLKDPAQMEAAKAAANTVLAESAVGKWVTWKLKVGKSPPWDSPWVVPNKSRIAVPEQTMNVDATVFGVRMMVYLGAEAESIVTSLSTGEEVTLTSYLNKVDFSSNEKDGTKLNLDLSRTRIEIK